MSEKVKTLILGMGNAIVSDDAIGLIIAEKIKQDPYFAGVDIETIESGGLAILEMLQGYHLAIIIDSIKTGLHRPGEIIRFRPEDFDCTQRSAGVHDVGFFTSLKLGRKLNMKIPERIEIIAVEIVENRLVSEDITPKVRAAVDPVIEMIKGML